MHLFNPNASKLLKVYSTIHNFTAKWLYLTEKMNSDFKNWKSISK